MHILVVEIQNVFVVITGLCHSHGAKVGHRRRMAKVEVIGRDIKSGIVTDKFSIFPFDVLTSRLRECPVAVPDK